MGLVPYMGTKRGIMGLYGLGGTPLVSAYVASVGGQDIVQL